MSNTVVINAIIAISLYPTPVLSDCTQEPLSILSFGIWLVAHIAYGTVLGGFAGSASTSSFKV
ncbi:MAG: hypothetical protein ACI33M_11250 [Lysinibacillus sp.]